MDYSLMMNQLRKVITFLLLGTSNTRRPRPMAAATRAVCTACAVESAAMSCFYSSLWSLRSIGRGHGPNGCLVREVPKNHVTFAGILRVRKSPNRTFRVKGLLDTNIVKIMGQARSRTNGCRNFLDISL